MSGTGSAPILSFAVASGLVWWLATRAARRLPVDTPNERSLHSTPVPRAGGIGLLGGFCTAAVLIAPGLPATLWVAVALLIAVSLVDDFRALPASLRLAAHLFAAAIFSVPLLIGDYGLMVAVLMTLAAGWMINLYNFMDGSDGLAGGMAVSGFTFFAIAAALDGNADFALLNASLAAAAAAFLLFNFHPARIFLGDAGSVPLGFLAAAFGLIGWLNSHWPWWFPLLVFSPFIVDASVTLARRLLSRARVWEAHRDHYYQRLVRLGLGHRNTALAEYALMAACGVAGLWAMKISPASQLTVLAAVAAVYLALIGTIEHIWRKRPAGDV
ncbi:MAG: glycosyltransferase family 4 protein [Burkholderiales bacterium]|nr:glycosyltransferase family 4 protein [Burkholderiales bacterium]